jgi:hypothetical protein
MEVSRKIFFVKLRTRRICSSIVARQTRYTAGIGADVGHTAAKEKKI